VKTTTALAVSAIAVASCGRTSIDLPSADRLSQQVTIRRDTFGIPHILAESEEAAAFAFGYAQAEDHAIEIARRLVSARGEEARYFGASGLANDVGMAQFDNVAEARRGLTLVSPLYRRILAAYAAGVNRYVAQHRSELPEWVPSTSGTRGFRCGATAPTTGSTFRRRHLATCGRGCTASTTSRAC
jgi:acyl-homoserine-lactone acylase